MDVPQISHLTLVISDWLFLTDYRLWAFAIKPLDELHFAMSLNYLIPFALYWSPASFFTVRCASAGRTAAIWRTGEKW